MISQIQLIQKVKAFYASHLQVKRCEAEFLEQIGNYTDDNEKFPLVFMVINGSSPEGYLINYDVDLYCLDIIRKKRDNVNSIVSDCASNLMDFYVYWTQSSDTSLDILNVPQIENVNNQFEDYLAGSKMNLQIQAEMQSECELPIDFEDLETKLILINENSYLLIGDGNRLTYG